MKSTDNIQDQEDIITILREAFPSLQSEFGVSRLGLFGSFTRGESSRNSDVDIIAEFERPIGLRFVEFVERLDKIIGRKTDVLTPAGVSGIRNKEIKDEILRTIVYV